MKTKMRTLLLMPFFALLFFTSCQEEKVEITPPAESEALVATSELTSFISATSAKDGSIDNIIDKASCLSIELPVTVVVNGLEIIVDSIEDYKVIETIFNKFEDDDDNLEIVFPITIILSDYTEISLSSREDLEAFIDECGEENEEDEDIECIDFQYPLSFSIYDTSFQVIDVITVENDRDLFFFIKRVKNEEGLLASLNFPVTMVYADGTTTVVNNNEALERTIEEAKDTCDEDDDNDYGDDDFTKERLDNLLKICPWVVHEFQRNEEDLYNQYSEYAIVFKEDNVTQVRTRDGDILTGTWTTRVTDNGALIKLEFDTLVDFTLEWFVYEIEYGKIKLYQAGGNKIILEKNCDVVIDFTQERIKSYLQECLWRVSRLSVDGVDNEKDYIGTPLSFFENNVVKLRVKGELVEGTYSISEDNANGFILQIALENRPDLQLEWLITFLEPDLIKLESLGNRDNKMMLKRHCADEDVNYIDSVVTNGQWEVASYIDEDVDKTDELSDHTIIFLESGYVDVIAPGGGLDFIGGSWLAYRNEGLFLGLQFEAKDQFAPFYELNHRWEIKEISQDRIELKDLDANGGIERILVLEWIEW
ncbi:hypothetical protein [Flavivirga jejuensis]|uniref:Lipocalin-like domain-containing protein n=1 Tax=Flavivirga jejuensis TaxID=870487 RepID=A0ABT8WJU2_9FLAO|nr:hypothetical protein [Flavivirga jejuensis]MDO5973345.1 hypothetical protein [Flavivirga jejuensis]